MIKMPESFVAFTCVQCSVHLPVYCEATRSDYPLMQIDIAALIAVVFHLSACSSCRQVYEDLELLSEQKGCDERGDPEL
jgi:predicted anti-sigma-YlaC factor YlaD